MSLAVTNRRGAGSVLSIQVLGRFELKLDGQPVEMPSRKARALLGYLVLNESCEESRERLVAFLWSTADTEHARGSLRQCLREVRTALPETAFDGFQADRLAITLDRNRVSVDLWTVLEEARQGKAPARLLDGPELIDNLLNDLDSVDPEFGSWIAAKRQAWRDRLLRLLEVPLRTHVQDEREAMDVAHAILNLDPSHEEACRSLMRILAARGDPNSAVKLYDRLWAFLDREYDSRPDQKTMDLVAEIKSNIPLEMDEPALPRRIAVSSPDMQPAQSVQALEASAKPAAPSNQAIVVKPTRFSVLAPVSPAEAVKIVLSIAPFALTGPDGAPAYILQGFRRELIASLVRFREWVVREPVGVPTPSPANIDEYVLEADGIHIGQSIRLSLTLKELSSNSFLWSEILDLKLENLFDAQRIVVRRIATALNVHLSAGRMASIAPRPVENLKAYDVWLLGQATILTFDPKMWEKAELMFRRVIQEMPDFAPAYSSLAQLQNGIHFALPGVMRDAERARESLTFARTSVRLDPIDSRAQLSLGWSMAMAGHHDAAAVHHSLAIELNENDPWTLMSSGLGFAFRGDYRRANELADRALSLSLTPTSINWWYQSMIRYLGQDYDGCIHAASEAEAVFPHVAVWKACALRQLDRQKDAQEAVDRFFSVTTRQWFKSEKPTRADMARWFLYSYPIGVPQDWVRLRDNFAALGAPTEDLSYNGW